MKEDSFVCINCGKNVTTNNVLGTQNRNHCPFCLWSIHLDLKPGDRKSFCKGKEKPIGITFKKSSPDKFGKEKVGELMVVHLCQECKAISVNRIAGDDDPSEIILLANRNVSLTLEINNLLKENKVSLLGPTDLGKIKIQLFGNK